MVIALILRLFCVYQQRKVPMRTRSLLHLALNTPASSLPSMIKRKNVLLEDRLADAWRLRR